MRKLYAILLISVLSVSAVFGQKPHMSVYEGRSSMNPSKLSKFLKGLDYSAELSAGPSLDDRSKFSLGVCFFAAHRFNDTLSLGLGAGFRGSQGKQIEIFNPVYAVASSKYDFEVLLPVFARLRATPYRFGRWTPGVMLDLGATIRLTESRMGGLFFEPALGVDYKLNSRLKLNLALGVNWMQTAYNYENYWYSQTERIGSSTTTLMCHVGLDF